jgi:endoglucanase
VDGTVAKVEFFNGSTKLGEDVSAPFTFSIASAAKGSYLFTAKATDNRGLSATSAGVSITVSDIVSGSGCSFGTPLNTPLPSFDRSSYSKVYVLGSGGPNLSNFRQCRINWNSNTKIFSQFAINTSNGVPAFYIDIKAVSTQTFGSNKPDIKITGSGLPGFDGEYWVTKVGVDFVMVSKTKGYTIYFSNAATAPVCTVANSSIAGLSSGNVENTLQVYPNPATSNTLTLLGLDVEKTMTIEIADLQGKTLLKRIVNNVNNNQAANSFDVSGLGAGTYIIIVRSKKSTKSGLFTKR